MSRFFVGQRIKKVRGTVNIGVTGIVVSEPVSAINQLDGCDMCVLVDKTGQIGAAESKNWEPITDQHKPCEAKFKQQLDQLLGEHA